MHAECDGWLQVLSSMIGTTEMPVPFSYRSYDKVEINDADGNLRDIDKIATRRVKSPAWIKVDRRPARFVREGTTRRLLDPKDAAAYIRNRFPGWFG